jgi:hypothetical protein
MACDVTAVVKGEHLPLIRSEYLRRTERRTERRTALPATSAPMAARRPHCFRDRYCQLDQARQGERATSGSGSHHANG